MDKEKSRSNTVLIICMIIVSLILLPILAINLTLIIKGGINKDVPPDLFGIAPLAVSSGSMRGDLDDSFDKGALIFVKLLDGEEKNELRDGDVITFTTSDVFVTHRIVSVNKNPEGQAVSFVTKGDANNDTDGAIPADNVLGVCVSSIAGAGNFALFLQTPIGILLFIGLPVLAFILFDVLRNYFYNKKVRKEIEKRYRDIEALAGDGADGGATGSDRSKELYELYMYMKMHDKEHKDKK